jgi:hypothetical protein
VADALRRLALFGRDDLYQLIVARLQANDHGGRQQWPLIAN